MNFLKDDEFIILMASNDEKHLLPSVGERSRMRELGIQTCHEQPSWALIEPAQGQYNWGYLDNIIKNNRDAGMKSLIQLTGWKNPTWMPDDWFCKTKDGKIEREALSLWNEEAQKHSDNFYRLVIDRYKSHKDVRFFFGEYQGGEGVLPPTWAIYDDAAVKDFRYFNFFDGKTFPLPEDGSTMDWLDKSVVNHLVRKGQIFYDAYKEVWNAQQYLMDTWTHAFGNFAHIETLLKMHKAWSDANIVLLQYTYFDNSHDINCVNYVDRLVDAVKCEVIVEAMFCAGLPITTPKAIAKGFRGQILHPQKNSFAYEPIEDWMFENIKRSQELWLASREK